MATFSSAGASSVPSSSASSRFEYGDDYEYSESSSRLDDEDGASAAEYSNSLLGKDCLGLDWEGGGHGGIGGAGGDVGGGGRRYLYGREATAAAAAAVSYGNNRQDDGDKYDDEENEEMQPLTPSTEPAKQRRRKRDIFRPNRWKSTVGGGNGGGGDNDNDLGDGGGGMGNENGGGQRQSPPRSAGFARAASAAIKPGSPSASARRARGIPIQRYEQQQQQQQQHHVQQQQQKQDQQHHVPSKLGRDDPRTPLSSSRDPRRRPLIGRTPFAPSASYLPTATPASARKAMLGITPSGNTKTRGHQKRSTTAAATPATRTNAVGLEISRQGLAVRATSATSAPPQPGMTPAKSATKKTPAKDRAITPAYAYKNSDTGLLEIRPFEPPTPSHIALTTTHATPGKGGGAIDARGGMDDAHGDIETGLVRSGRRGRGGGGAADGSEVVEEQNLAPALYPIALNGGGVGLYRDPREFASNKANAHSRNLRLMGGRRAPIRSHIAFRWRRGEWGYGVSDDHKRNGSDDEGGDDEDGFLDEAVMMPKNGIVDVSEVENGGFVDVELGEAVADAALSAARSTLRSGRRRPRRPLSTRSSTSSNLSGQSSRSSAPSPWRLWESVHNEMVRLREQNSFRIRRAAEEDGGSAVVDMVRHRAECDKLGRISGIYNDDDFDFALVLSPRDVYAYWADHLDFRQEIFGEDGALLFGDEDDLIGDGGVSTGQRPSAEGIIPPTRKNLGDDLGKENTPTNRRSMLGGHSLCQNDEESSLHCDDDYIDNASTDEEMDSLLSSQYGTPGRGTKKRRRRRTNTEASSIDGLSTPPRSAGPSIAPRTAPPAGRRENLLASPDSLLMDDSGRKVLRPGRKSIFEQAVDALTPPRSGRKSGLFGRRSISPKRPRSSRRPPIKHTPSMRRAPLHDLNDITTPMSNVSDLSPGLSGGPASASRRQWGMAHGQDRMSSRRNLMTPPVKSLEKKNSLRSLRRQRANTADSSGERGYVRSEEKRRQRSKAIEYDDSSDDENGEEGREVPTAAREVVDRADYNTGKASKRRRRRRKNDLDADEIPSQTVPRGIAARTAGMDEFLLALKRGIVVRRHRPHAESAFIKLFSVDGGDTIQFCHVASDEAMIAFKEQAVRFNRGGASAEPLAANASQRWSHEIANKNLHEQDTIQNFNLPDFIAAERYREAWSRTQGNVKKKVVDMATRATHRGEIKTVDVVSVHPAIHPDPFSGAPVNDELPDHGTTTLRASPSEFVEKLSFSLVLPGTFDRLKGNHSSKVLSERWHSGAGSYQAFRYLDIETATEGEYWMIFRGFLLLHRDAASGRFAAQRAQGIGSNYTRHEIEEMEQQRNRLNVEKGGTRMEGNTGAGDGSGLNGFLDEYVEPSNNNFFDRLSKTLHFGPSQTLQYQPVNAPPPPSDYFLGFKSPGTQIWSRLRQSGLETQRIYALDTRRVMIKVRCPAERLMDVAEVLRLKLRTTEGTYEAFRESQLERYLPSDEGTDTRRHSNESTLFRSSERQAIIDFIIRSRIRDSGAELGPRTDLGKAIASRVPLHMHARLEPLYESWVLFWREENWDGRDGKSMRVGSERDGTRSSSYENATDDGDDSSQGAEEGRRLPTQYIPTLFTRLFSGCWYQPLDSIEEYYGEKIAFYFAWLQHVSFHLIFLSACGWIVFICQIASGNWDHPIRPFFSAIIMLWSFVVMVTWRRRSNFLAHRWGTLNYEEEETTRPQFSGVYKFDEITQEWTVYYPSWKRWLKYCISFPLSVMFTLITLLGILMLYANRDIALARYFDDKNSPGESTFNLELNILAIGRRSSIDGVKLSSELLKDSHFWAIIGGFPLVLGLTLPLLNFILMRISIILNEFENYRTETQYRNHLIVKVFSFRFVCYFAALYYYAFIATGTDENATENGILRVATSLFIYVTVAHWWTIFLQVYAPMILYRWRMYRERLSLRDAMKDVEAMEEDFTESGRTISAAERKHRQKRLINSRLLLEQAQSNIWEEMMLPNHDSFPEYIVAVVQFAYVTCFSTALPITPFIVLINHLLAMRLDAYKLCRGRRRPLAQKTGGIGVWEHVLHIVTVIAVFTNCTLMALTSSLFKWLGTKIGHIGLLVVAVGVSWGALLDHYRYQLPFNCFLCV